MNNAPVAMHRGVDAASVPEDSSQLSSDVTLSTIDGGAPRQINISTFLPHNRRRRKNALPVNSIGVRVFDYTTLHITKSYNVPDECMVF